MPLVLPELAERRSRRLLDGQVAPPVARVAVVRPDEAVDAPRLLLARLAASFGLELLLGRGGGRFLAELDVVETSLGWLRTTNAAAPPASSSRAMATPAAIAARAACAQAGPCRSRVPACHRGSSSACATRRPCAPRRGSRASGSSAARSATRCWGEPRELDRGGGRSSFVACRVAARIGGELVVHERFGTATVRARARWYRPGRAARALPRAGRAARGGARGDHRGGPRPATSRSTRSRWPWPTAPWPRSHTPRRISAGPVARAPRRVVRRRPDAAAQARPLRRATRLAPEPHTAALAAAAGSTASAASASLSCAAPRRAAARRLQALARYAPALLPGLDPDWTDRGCARGRAARRAARPARARGGLARRRRAAAGARVPGRRPEDPPRPAAPRRSARRSMPRPRRRTRRVLRREPVEVAVLAGRGAGPAMDRRVAPRAAAVSGVDLLTAGLRGPEIGAGLDAATDALLDGWRRIGGAAGGGAGSTVQRHPRHHEADAEHLERRGDLREDDHPDHGRRPGGARRAGRRSRGQLRHRELVAHVGDDRRGDADADPGGDRDGVVERDGVPERGAA